MLAAQTANEDADVPPAPPFHVLAYKTAGCNHLQNYLPNCLTLFHHISYRASYTSSIMNLITSLPSMCTTLIRLQACTKISVECSICKRGASCLAWVSLHHCWFDKHCQKQSCLLPNEDCHS